MSQKALIVDDTKLICDIFSQQLTACGFQARSCNSLDDTINIVQVWQPDVVFLDLRMPSHDGFAVIEQLHAKFSTPPKVIAVSGEASSLVRLQVEEAGFAGFLVKPFRIAQVLAILKKVLAE